MISAKKLINMARKWQSFAAVKRKSIELPQAGEGKEMNGCITPSVAEKGHFVVYSADEKRFLLPLEYLNNEIIRELLRLAEEEFGLPGNGPLTLPCDAELMEYVAALIKRNVTRDVQRALLMSIISSRCSFDPLHPASTHQLPICSF
ncbi:hypothetical protein Tsubulata_044939 [Turnera subulata]|uniref:Uncharacterized protein n=1 Tax=Turnera subulata TaxID=218843 RepID=A0A9Q0FJW1_9ROSI|nr:hypothetical protein Tsubulata_044939 [Turnera subulata]